MANKLCELCGKKIYGRGTFKYKDGWHTYCHSCRTQRAKRIKNNDTRIRNKAYRITQELIKKQGKQCENCGKNGPVDGHHIKPLRNGGKNTADNIKLLCKSCHRKAHPKGTRY